MQYDNLIKITYVLLNIYYLRIENYTRVYYNAT